MFECPDTSNPVVLGVATPDSPVDTLEAATASSNLSNGEIGGIAAGIILFLVVAALCILLYVHNSVQFRYWLARGGWRNNPFTRVVGHFRHLAEGIRIWRTVRAQRPQSGGFTENRFRTVLRELYWRSRRIGTENLDSSLGGAQHNPTTGLSNDNVDLERQVVDDVEPPRPNGTAALKKVRFQGPKIRAAVSGISRDSSTPATSAVGKGKAMNSPLISPISTRTRSKNKAVAPSAGPSVRPGVAPPLVPHLGLNRKATRCCGACGQVHEAGQACYRELYTRAHWINAGLAGLDEDPYRESTAPPPSPTEGVRESSFLDLDQLTMCKKFRAAAEAGGGSHNLSQSVSDLFLEIDSLIEDSSSDPAQIRRNLSFSSSQESDESQKGELPDTNL